MAVSIILCIVMSALYLVRPPNVDPITIWPFWFWALPGIFIGLLGVRRRTLRQALLALGLWAVAVGSIAEEPRMMLRLIWHRTPVLSNHDGDEQTLRVVSLNCAGGQLPAAAEALAQDPDIVLLQETPSQLELTELVADRPGWKALAAFDGAILVRGVLEPVALGLQQKRFFCYAFATPSRLGSNARVAVISTRLTLPSLRLGPWRPATWRGAARARAIRAKDMAQLAEKGHDASSQMPTIVGGDFNAPAGDSLFRVLKPHLRDAFAEGGSGWPNTIINDTPWSRIDQIWISDHFAVRSGHVLPTEHSDHRMVVIDLILQPSGARPHRKAAE